MLRNLKDLKGFSVNATDGNIGHVCDVLFDDDAWVVRYLVVETGSWLASRKVLITPIAVRGPNWTERVLPVCITKEQVRNSPDIDTDKSVSRQHESDFLSYYGYPYYWGGAGLWGGGMYPYAMFPGYSGYAGSYGDCKDRRDADHVFEKAEQDRHAKDDPDLRSCEKLAGYHIHATDGEVGHLSGLLVDQRSWAIQYLVVDTSNWWKGHKVLVAPEWIDRVCWDDQSITVDLQRHAIKNAPPYHPNAEANRDNERRVCRNHERSGYWLDDMPAKQTARRL